VRTDRLESSIIKSEKLGRNESGAHHEKENSLAKMKKELVFHVQIVLENHRRGKLAKEGGWRYSKRKVKRKQEGLDSFAGMAQDSPK